MANNLKKITTLAKKIRKEKPEMMWQDAVKTASKQLKTHTKKVGMATQSNIPVRGNSLVAGTKKKKRRVGAVNAHGSSLMRVVADTAGAVIGTYIGSQITQKNPKMAMLGLAGGMVGQFVAKKGFINSISQGIAGGAGAMLLKRNVPQLAGVNDMLDQLGQGNALVAGPSDVMVFDYTTPAPAQQMAQPEMNENPFHFNPIGSMA